MAAEHDSAPFACSLIELIGRLTRQEHSDVVALMGRVAIGHIYAHPSSSIPP